MRATLSMVSPMWLFNRKGPPIAGRSRPPVIVTSIAAKNASAPATVPNASRIRPSFMLNSESKTYEIRSAPLRSSAQGIGPPLTALERFFGPPYSRGCILLKVMYLMFDRCAGRVVRRHCIRPSSRVGSPTGACKPSVILPSSWNNQRVEESPKMSAELKIGIQASSNRSPPTAADTLTEVLRTGSVLATMLPRSFDDRWFFNVGGEIEQAEPFGPV